LDGIKNYAEKYGIEVMYDKGCEIQKEDESIDTAVEIAEKSDIIIAVVGDNNKLNGEQKDRCDLNLTGKQQELLEALKATGKPLIVILINGKPLSIPWIEENADAIQMQF